MDKKQQLKKWLTDNYKVSYHDFTLGKIESIKNYIEPLSNIEFELYLPHLEMIINFICEIIDEEIHDFSYFVELSMFLNRLHLNIDK